MLVYFGFVGGRLYLHVFVADLQTGRQPATRATTSHQHTTLALMVSAPYCTDCSLTIVLLNAKIAVWWNLLMTVGWVTHKHGHEVEVENLPRRRHKNNLLFARDDHQRFRPGVWQQVKTVKYKVLSVFVETRAYVEMCKSIFSVLWGSHMRCRSLPLCLATETPCTLKQTLTVCREQVICCNR